MIVASWILLCLGVLGAVDIALFHCLAHDLRRHRRSRAELVTHALRGPTYALLFTVVPSATLRGAYVWALAALLAFDFAISVVDFALERDSRRDLGGLSSGEYLLHVGIAILFGALVTAVAFEGGASRALPTSITWGESAVPWALRALMAVMALGALVSAAFDAAAVVRLGRAPRD